MNTEIQLKITEIQRFCMHDGPGIRTTVFLKGCPLSCAWCHNPETQKSSQELLFYAKKCILCGMCADVCQTGTHKMKDCHTIDRQKCRFCHACVQNCPTGALDIAGKDMTISEILQAAEKDRMFYGNEGGITLSGGEPFLQKDATVALLKACKEHGLSTAVETCGYTDSQTLKNALPYIDTLLWDLKDTDNERHLQYTGVSNKVILENLKIAAEHDAKIRLRCILVNKVNTNKAHYQEIARIALGISSLLGVEFIPYHAYAGSKAVFIGREDNGNPNWIPTEAQLTEAGLILQAHGISVL